MAKKASKKKPAAPKRATELGKATDLIERLNKYSVPELQLDKSLEECRQLNDQFELVKVEALEVESPQHYTDYGSLLRKIKTVEKRLEEQRAEQKAPHLEGGRVVDAKFKGFQGFAVRLRRLFDDAMSVYDKQQEFNRREEERKLREKARKEKERLERAAEKKAAKLEAAGKEDEADAVREAVPEIPTPVVEQKNVPKVAGVSSTKRYAAELTEENEKKQEKLLRAAIAAWNLDEKNEKRQIIDVEYWTLDRQKLSAVARSLKGKLDQPDITVVDSNSRSVRV